MSRLPSGTVTFLFTDVERSTQTVEALGNEAYADVLDTHRQLLRDAFKEHGAHEVGTEGDAFFVAFTRAHDAAAAAVAAQRCLEGHPLRVRMGIHTGEALVRVNEYVGHDVHKAKRICDAGHGGQILLSQTTADLVSSRLRLKDLGPHRLKDLGEPQRLYQVVADDLPTSFPRLRTLEAAPHNLPVQLTSFVGRERELEDVRHLLATTRLLTITGAGGCGKTRLAVQVGAEVLHDFPNGVWLADLAAVTDPALVPQAVADAVGAPRGHADEVMTELTPEERLRAHLDGRRALVILDNCEHLIGACADLVTNVLGTTSEVRILVTTREPLGVAGETSWRLPSLSVPARARPEDLMEAEATRLFCDRAAQAVPGFAPAADDGRAIVDICTRLDGIPLAIELAAVRVRVLSCVDIANRLDDRFRLLTGGSRTALPRQQTLRATVDWSYDLLADDQKELLRRLSVFAGGFTLNATEEVCADETLGRREILDHLTALVDRSLVLAVQSPGGSRYRLLDTVRHYAREKLLDGGAPSDLRTRHMLHFVTLVERTAPELRGPASRSSTDTLEGDFANIRQAFEWALNEEPMLALRAVGALSDFWTTSARRSEGKRWAVAALEATEDAPSRERVRALYVSAMGSAHPVSEKLLAEATHMARAIADDEQLAALTLLRADFLINIRGEIEPGRKLAGQALTHARAAGSELQVAQALRYLAIAAARDGDLDRARQLLEESLEIARRLGDLHQQSNVESTLGTFARMTRNWETARSHFARQLELAHASGCRNCQRLAQINLAWLARGRGDHEEAAEFARDSVRTSYEDRDEVLLYFGIGAFAMIAYDSGRLERAARLLGAQDRLRASVGTLGDDPAAAEQRRVARVRNALGEGTYEQQFAIGKRMSLNEAVAYALEEPG